MTNEVTIYVMLTPLKTVAHAYVNEQEAKEEMLNTFLPLGEKYSLEPCALKVDFEFIKRVYILLSQELEKREKKGAPNGK